VVGYCIVCGAFGCPECLNRHEGNWLCAKHYRPIAQKQEEERRREEVRKRHPRQLLVARYADGTTKYGVCFALNPKEPSFRLEMVDKNGAALGASETVRFEDLKAVFVVKSFDGKFDKTRVYREGAPEGQDLVVKFRDGEALRGVTLRPYNPDDARFYLVPTDPKSNNISILAEARAVDSVCTPEEYKALRTQEQAKRVQMEREAALSQEETLGDFHLENRDYPAALEQYRLAATKYPESIRIRKKVLLAYFNVGIQFIKRHEYPKALAYMEAALKLDPRNERVSKKVSQLKHILEKQEEARTTGPGMAPPAP
jgi:tetratricopeptide (TPR) repeat protein